MEGRRGEEAPASEGKREGSACRGALDCKEQAGWRLCQEGERLQGGGRGQEGEGAGQLRLGGGGWVGGWRKVSNCDTHTELARQAPASLVLRDA
jgi:hypothetical protein